MPSLKNIPASLFEKYGMGSEIEQLESITHLGKEVRCSVRRHTSLNGDRLGYLKLYASVSENYDFSALEFHLSRENAAKTEDHLFVLFVRYWSGEVKIFETNPIKALGTEAHDLPTFLPEIKRVIESLMRSK